MHFCINPLPDEHFLDLSKLKECADDIFKFDENGRKLSKREENTVGKGEIALQHKDMQNWTDFLLCKLGTI